MPHSMEVNESTAAALFVGAGVTTEPESIGNLAGLNLRSNGSFNLQDFIARHLSVKREDAYNGGKKYLLKACPFNPEHVDNSAVLIEFADGAISFRCQHNSCSHLKWRDLRQKFEPGCYDRPEVKPGKVSNAVDESAVEVITYQAINGAELDAGNYEVEYLIEDVLIAGQPMVWAGGKKSLKTNGILDAGISLASGSPFLGKFNVNRQVRVAIMSGESGLGTIQETCRRICSAKELQLSRLDSLIISPDLPQLADPNHQEALRRWLRRYGIEQLVLDPAYLCMPGDDAGNLFMQGAMLRSVSEVCRDAGTGLIIAHHTRKNIVNPFQPAELEDISWAGYQEFARQWVLVSRRVAYDPDNAGHHELWLTIGGSAGHSSLWAWNVDEGSPKDPGGRRWQVELVTAKEARQDSQEQQEAVKQQTRDSKHQAKVNAAKEAIASAFRSVPNNADTKTQIQERAGTKGAAFNEAWGELMRTNKITEAEITRANGQRYPGFRFNFGDKPE